MKKIKQVIFYCEGETEKNLIVSLKSDPPAFLHPGKLKKFNLWQNNVKKILRVVNKKDILLCFIIDTDATSNDLCFINNLKVLSNYQFCLLVQNKNLEDELVFCCSVKDRIELFSALYQCKSSSEFKSKFAQDKKLFVKLRRLGFQFHKLWSRSDDFKKLFSIIDCRNNKSVIFNR